MEINLEVSSSVLLSFSVYFFTVAQFYYEDIEFVIIYLVNYPVVTNPNTPCIFPAKLASAVRPRDGCKIVDCINNAVLVRLRNS